MMTLRQKLSLGFYYHKKSSTGGTLLFLDGMILLFRKDLLIERLANLEITFVENSHYRYLIRYLYDSNLYVIKIYMKLIVKNKNYHINNITCEIENVNYNHFKILILKQTANWLYDNLITRNNLFYIFGIVLDEEFKIINTNYFMKKKLWPADIKMIFY